jgi:hypothetical protein
MTPTTTAQSNSLFVETRLRGKNGRAARVVVGGEGRTAERQRRGGARRAAACGAGYTCRGRPRGGHGRCMDAVPPRAPHAARRGLREASRRGAVRRRAVPRPTGASGPLAPLAPHLLTGSSHGSTSAQSPGPAPGPSARRTAARRPAAAAAKRFGSSRATSAAKGSHSV